MFIKHGDGKIVGILDEENLTEEQKKSVKSQAKQTTKPANATTTDASSEEKNSGR
jgi:hypothetical protein